MKEFSDDHFILILLDIEHFRMAETVILIFVLEEKKPYYQSSRVIFLEVAV